MAETPAGWYPDHYNPERERYWSGTEWTDDYRPRPAPPSQEATTGGWATSEAAPPEYTRPCPFCAEPVKNTAVVCRHCGRDLAGGPPSRTNGFAIASMVLGIVWIYWIGSILALVFGYVALHQIRQSRGTQGGRGMAIAGVVLGWIGIALLMLGIVAVAVSPE
jgi:hypothetical protein